MSDSRAPGPTRPPTITSPANPRLRAAAELRGRGARRARGQLLVDGAREVGRALDGGAAVAEAFVEEPLPASDELAAVVARLEALGVPVVRASSAALDRVAYGNRASGVVAVVAAPSTSLDALDARRAAAGAGSGAEAADELREPLIVVLEGVEKPGNLGAVCRTADGAGADALIVASDAGAAADPWNPNAVRASLGAVFTMPLAVAPADAVVAWLRARGTRIVAARVDGRQPYADIDLRGPLALVLGSEASGLSALWAGADVVAARLPMLGRVDSLNVAAASAVLLYEARRQRDQARSA